MRHLDLLYGRIIAVIAKKTSYHVHCDAECKRAGHEYIHEFTTGAKLMGLPDGACVTLPNGHTFRVSNGSMLISDKEY